MKKYFSWAVFFVFSVLLRFSEASNTPKSFLKRETHTLEETEAKENAVSQKIIEIEKFINSSTETQLGEFVALNSTISQSKKYNSENYEKIKSIYYGIKNTDQAIALLYKSLETELADCFFNYEGCGNDSILTKKVFEVFHKYERFLNIRSSMSNTVTEIKEIEDKDYEKLILIHIWFEVEFLNVLAELQSACFIIFSILTPDMYAFVADTLHVLRALFFYPIFTNIDFI
ncbi:hypothetical protein BB561_006858 [Smittium simulii]|uniref:Uncharacterized protein n=1 Tax=Smittium simulii TaxID=133385 RepID=A0A2T9Y0V2_9FUNG|nr:hypothetical protein BB561_006858 [Smittium simulii]